jgi:hypothetical protein
VIPDTEAGARAPAQRVHPRVSSGWTTRSRHAPKRLTCAEQGKAKHRGESPELASLGEQAVAANDLPLRRQEVAEAGSHYGFARRWPVTLCADASGRGISAVSCAADRIALRSLLSRGSRRAEPGQRDAWISSIALVSRGATETAARPRMRKRGGRVQPEPVRGLFVGGRASDVMASADPRDRGEPAQSTTHSSTSPLPSLLTGFPATFSVGATDDRAAIRRRFVEMDLIVMLLVILIVLALVGSLAVSPLLWVLVIILVVFAVGGRGRYYGRRG